MSEDFEKYFRALRHRDFRIYIAGQILSLTGTWVQMVAQSWLVYRLSHSAKMLGLVAFAGQVPFLILSPIAGVVADRVNRRRLLIFTQVLAMCQAILMAALTFTDVVQVWHVFYLSLTLGVISVFDSAARQPFYVEMVNKDEVVNAIALNSTTFNGGRLLGSALAGVLIAVIGEGLCFLINGLSFLAAIASLLMLRIPNRKPEAGNSSPLQNLREGWRYAWHHAPARALFLLLGLSSIMNYSFHQVLMPIFAGEVLRGGPKNLGMLMSSLGSGVVLGAIYMSGRTNAQQLCRNIISATVMCSLMLISFSFSRNVYLSMVLLLFVGAGLMLSINGINATLQTIVPDSLRGRVAGGFYILMFQGTIPIGQLLGGWLGSLIGAPWTVALGGMVCIGGALAFKQRSHLVQDAVIHATRLQGEWVPDVPSAAIAD